MQVSLPVPHALSARSSRRSCGLRIQRARRSRDQRLANTIRHIRRDIPQRRRGRFMHKLHLLLSSRAHAQLPGTGGVCQCSIVRAR